MATPQDSSRDLLARLRGLFRVQSLVKVEQGKEESILLGMLRVFPSIRSDPDAEPGQWILSIEPEHNGNQRESLFIGVASRLGLLPVHWAPAFERLLRRDGPLCLIADTNALYHGTLQQALAVRAGRATHVAIADQAMMEMQRQRERAWKPQAHPAVSKANTDEATQQAPTIETWARAVRRSTFLAAGGRALRRLREAGHIVHVARPPAAMVRYFGGSRGGSEEDEGVEGELVGSNALRDRLILEAAFQQRVDLPGVPVVLVTDDALLAEQATVERLDVGFGWPATEIRPRFVTSPYVDPRTFQLMHVPVREFLEELVWSCPVITLQRAEEGRMIVGRAPESKHERALVAMGEEGYGIVWREARNIDPWKLETGSSVPRRAPPADKLLLRLLSWHAGQANPEGQGGIEGRETEEIKTIDAYLRALGWLRDQSGKVEITERGRHLASRWLLIGVKDVRPWVSWMLDAATDLSRLSPLQDILKCVEENPKVTDKRLAELTGETERTLSAQLNLANALGIAVRLGAQNWRAATWTEAEAENAVLQAITEVAARGPAGVRAASVARVFTSLLPQKPMALPVFRGALERLGASGRVRFSGASPEASAVKLRTLEPSVEGADSRVQVREVDLGHGNFLLPDTPCVVAEVVPEDRAETMLESGGRSASQEGS